MRDWHGKVCRDDICVVITRYFMVVWFFSGSLGRCDFWINPSTNATASLSAKCLQVSFVCWCVWVVPPSFIFMTKRHTHANVQAPPDTTEDIRIILPPWWVHRKLQIPVQFPLSNCGWRFRLLFSSFQSFVPILGWFSKLANPKRWLVPHCFVVSRLAAVARTRAWFSIVYGSDGHWTRSAKHHALFTLVPFHNKDIVIEPSLGTGLPLPLLCPLLPRRQFGFMKQAP